ncbi:protein phosphatase 2C domain-containing protein [Streptomyces sp. NPDC002917]|uniref:protein phosphatase 2C domain-containing protein n=1 Tax=unclassified Streptomyces TaxID=2593676 RepID=UPI002E809F28|nr:protein phosphatase 2C domain-containing protein [Streptomyces sp. NBC_00562]WTC78888.1 protein phosphatase 2C domain-containing protein [Streptomyces sp. NBC_01653]WTD91975.1 protein phosphatase 2C domain-containing protein [Streptomyces sp. NBC_01637]WUC23016.1 protein phosphatase 2C domain-containing protein [Streptomyces sp. NBC_00562]
MSQQGERPAAHEDDWWRRLYDETAADTGSTNAADSLDDRFDSASDAVGPAGWDGPGRDDGYRGADAAVPDPRTPPEPPVQARAPWEPPTEAERAPWEPPRGAARTRTFAAPPVPAPPLVDVPPPAPPPGAERPGTVDGPPPVPAPSQVPAPTPDPAPSQVPVPPPVQASPPVPAPPEHVPPLPRRPVAERAGTPEESAPAGATGSDSGATPAGPDPVAPGSASRPGLMYVGDRPPTYDAEPTALPATTPQELDGLVADTVLDGARYGTYTLRAASVRGDSARFRGEPRRDALLTVRFGAAENALVLVAVASGARAAEGAHLAAADACRWIGGAVGRSHARLAEDIRAGRRGDLKSGLHRLTDRSYGRLRARAAELGLEPHEYTAGLRCLLLSADPDCRTRVFFGVGGGGLFRLRDGVWRDLEPDVPAPGAVTGEPVVGFGSASPESGPHGDRLTMDLGITTPPSPYIESPPPPPAEPFRFRASVARPGDTLLLCSTGLAEPLRGESALADELAERWTPQEPPGLAAFLADTQLRVKGYADDRTSVGVWEA